MNRGAQAIFLAIIATASAAVIPTAASATSKKAWSNPPTALPATTNLAQAYSYSDPVGGALFFYIRDGVPTLSRVQAEGNLTSTAAVPSITGEVTSGVPEQVAFRPDGSSIVVWKVQGTGHAYMAFRAESGAFGTPVQLDQNIRTVAVSGTEILALSADGSVVSEAPFTIVHGNVIIGSGASTNIYNGGADRVYATMDSSGMADVIVQGVPDSLTTTQITDVNRNSAGSWGTGTTLSDPTSNVTDSSFAANPSGRAAVTWTESASDSGTAYAYVDTSMREAGGTFGWTGSVVNTNSTFGATATSLTAVGDDGTIAIAPSVITYSSASAYTVANSVYITPAASSGLGSGVPLNILFGAHSRLSALAAGNGEAVAGYLGDQTGPGDSNYPNSYNETRYAGGTVVNSDGTQSAHNFGLVTGIWDGTPADNCPSTECLGAAPPVASVLDMTVDSRGEMTALGQLTPNFAGDPVDFSARYLYSLKPKLTLTSKAVPASKKAAFVPLSCAKKDCVGKIVMTAVVKKTHKHGKPTKKTVKIAKSAYLLEIGQTSNVKVALTRAGIKAIKSAPGHSLHAALAITVTGAKKNLAKRVAVSR